MKWYNSGDKLVENNYGLKWEYIGNTKPSNGFIINNDYIKNKINNNELELSIEELELSNIDISNKNNYIELNINDTKMFYKPKTNINIGNNWVKTDIELNYYREYINKKLEKL